MSDSNAYSIHPTQLKMGAGNLIVDIFRGLQGIVLTDSLFMIRELYLFTNGTDISVKYINIYFDKDKWNIEQSDSIENMKHVSFLDESEVQDDRYMKCYTSI